MNMKSQGLLSLVAMAGLAASAYAQPTVVNLSGATLLENFLKAPAATNDYLDCDGDGFAGSLVPATIDNLTPTTTSTAWLNVPGVNSNDHWAVTYRVSGSVAGYQELVDFGQKASGNCAAPTMWPGQFVTGDAGLVNPPNVIFGNTSTGPVTNANASKQYYNGSLVYDTTIAVPFFSATLYSATNPAGLTFGANLTTLKGVPGTPAAGGYRVDVTPVDVPSTWAVQASAGTSSFLRLPTQAGYGVNPRTSVGSNGTGGGFQYSLVNLGARNLNIGSPDCNTIFDSQLAWAPIAMITSFGTGVRQMDQTEVNHFYATGRMLNGENLIAVTREIGSGTRNGFNNTAGIDPTWGVGDNVGGSAPQVGTTGNANLLGDLYAPCNKIGSGDVETTVRNTRLGMGYSGAERFSVANSARYDLVAIRCSLAGGTDFGRPTLMNICENNPTLNPKLYSLGGPAILATIGDPRNQAVLGGTPGNTNPPVANVEAAKFVNNITRSIENFITVPGTPATFGQPGEWAATLLILNPARQYVNNVLNPVALTPNAGYNAALYGALPPFSVLDDAQFQNFGTGSANLAGQSPNRRTGVGITYTDGVVNGANYINQAGVAINYNTTLTTRNRIAGDFNGDGLRNLNDATDMLRAFRQRTPAGPVWVAPAYTGPNPGAGVAGTDAVIEILGDFNGDGNFNAADIRYWADGLAIDPGTGKLDRWKGFVAVDNAWFSLTGNNNFFGTTKSSGGAYAVGESRFDVIGSGGIARGWAPVGANGNIDTADANYIRDQFIGNAFVSDGNANWDNLAEAVGFDLSGDMTGDLIVNQADLDAANAALGVGCYANCDNSTIAPILNVNDFTCFLNRFGAGDPYANCDNSTIAPVLNVNDFTCFLNRFGAGCP